MLRIVRDDQAATPEIAPLDLDELCRLAARELLAIALDAERRAYLEAHDWRTDRLATVIVPGSAAVQPSFAPVARHYGATIRPCPPRRGNRKGAVEASSATCAGAGGGR